MDDGSESVKVTDLRKFITECFVTVGLKKTYSEIVTECLVDADLTGHHSHGVFRLDKFIEDINRGDVDVHAEPTTTKETAATAWVDGKNGLGAIVGTYCMKIAMEKAKQVGAAIVIANNSNNYGIASFYGIQALKEGLLGISMTNSSPLMLPCRAKEPISGTNPICLAAPGLFGDRFLLDMATTVTSGGNIEIKYKNGEFLPVGWAVNAACLPETNPDVAVKSGRFLPVGSTEDLSSYKGTGLSIMVDILCGILGGAHYSHRVGVWVGRETSQHANVGHCFIAIDPKHFAPDFEVRLTEFLSYLRGLNPEDASKSVRVPGDRGRDIAKKIEETGGMSYPKYVVESLKNLAASLKIKCVPFIPKKRKVQMTPSEELAARLEAEKLLMGDISASIAEDEMAVPDSSLIDRTDVSFIMDDSSDWLCSITGFTYERDRALSLLKEKLGKFAQGGGQPQDDDSGETEVTYVHAGGETDESLTGEESMKSTSSKNEIEVPSEPDDKEKKENEIQITMDITGEINITGEKAE